MQRSETEKLFQESCRWIPGGVNSPVRAFQELAMLPLIVKKGKEDKIEDVDGNCWIDYCMSWGALPLGHAHPQVVKAIQEQAMEGSTFGIATALELEMAKKVVSHIPSMEKVRFVSSGTESTMSAIRLGRAVSGKSVLIKFNGCYHGHSDSLLVRAGSGVSALAESSSLGILKESVLHTLSLPYNDIETFRNVMRSRSDIGVVIVEPIAANMGLVAGKQEFLESLREETRKAGAVLIFDEVVSGFRVGLGGAQKLYGIDPDLTCLGKVIGGGLPAAAFGGKASLMDALAPLGGVYQAGTLSGNPLAMKAGLATLQELEKPFAYRELEDKTNELLSPIEEKIRSKKLPITIQRKGSLFTIFFSSRPIERSEDLVHLDKSLFRRFYLHLFERGVYLPPSQVETGFLSLAHTRESIEHTRKTIDSFLESI
jgi:glutamate-1-semialdehyde 2,1-aminomutase